MSIERFGCTFGILCIVGGLLSLFSVNFFDPSSQSVARSVATAAEAPQVITVGNRSYIPLPNLLGEASKYARTILDGIQLFEVTHPTLRVTNYQIEKDEAGYGRARFTGLWLTHEPR